MVNDFSILANSVDLHPLPAGSEQHILERSIDSVTDVDSEHFKGRVTR